MKRSIPNNEGYVVVLITAPSNDAEKIARELVESKLVACVNVINNVKSLYWWKGKVEEGIESVLICKTRLSIIDKLIKRVSEVHPYEVPEVIALPIVRGLDKYLEWVRESTSSH